MRMEELEAVEKDWVITVMGRSDVERSFAPVVDILKEQGLELDRIDLLTRAEKALACGSDWGGGGAVRSGVLGLWELERRRGSC